MGSAFKNRGVQLLLDGVSGGWPAAAATLALAPGSHLTRPAPAAAHANARAACLLRTTPLCLRCRSTRAHAHHHHHHYHHAHVYARCARSPPRPLQTTCRPRWMSTISRWIWTRARSGCCCRAASEREGMAGADVRGVVLLPCSMRAGRPGRGAMRWLWGACIHLPASQGIHIRVFTTAFRSTPLSVRRFSG